MRSLLGLRDLVSNVNIPNYGQIPNLPLGAVVETNAHFCADSVKPVFAGALPESIYQMCIRDRPLVSAKEFGKKWNSSRFFITMYSSSAA